MPVLEAGQRVFGENRVQEAKAKWPGLRERFPGVELHLIGPLQTNKAREAVELFDVIETLDRESLAVALGKRDRQAGTTRRACSCRSTRARKRRRPASRRARPMRSWRLPRAVGPAIEGLMCIPPADEPPSPHFALLATIARRNGLSLLSMGMSADFEAAIQLGATHVRVGSAIFGHR